MDGDGRGGSVIVGRCHCAGAAPVTGRSLCLARAGNGALAGAAPCSILGALGGSYETAALVTPRPRQRDGGDC